MSRQCFTSPLNENNYINVFALLWHRLPHRSKRVMLWCDPFIVYLLPVQLSVLSVQLLPSNTKEGSSGFRVGRSCPPYHGQTQEFNSQRTQPFPRGSGNFSLYTKYQFVAHALYFHSILRSMIIRITSNLFFYVCNVVLESGADPLWRFFFFSEAFNLPRLGLGPVWSIVFRIVSGYHYYYKFSDCVINNNFFVCPPLCCHQIGASMPEICWKYDPKGFRTACPAV